MVSQLSDVVCKTFDYIVIGGGTAGLTVAARLSEDSSKSVLVLEAGEPNLDDPKIMLGGQYGATWGDQKYDWGFETTPQKAMNDSVIPWNRGKGLGGTSAMNFWAWCKPPAQDVDAWETLGNPGWNWESYQKYVLRAEQFTPATELYPEDFARHNAEWRGKAGLIKTAVSYRIFALDKIFFDTAKNLDVPLLEDPYGGNITGGWTASSVIDRTAHWTRSYAATACYVPNINKPNFTVLTEAVTTRILFSEEKHNGNFVATGVEFFYSGKTYTANVGKEVICSAGTIKTPQLLELSGIGRRDVLQRIGVPLKVELPGVGENVQDHLFLSVPMEITKTIGVEPTFDRLHDPEFAKEQARLVALDEPNVHRYAINAFAYIPYSLANPEDAPSFMQKAEAHVQALKESGKLPPGLAEQYDLQLRALKDDKIPDVELIMFPGFYAFKTLPQPGTLYASFLCVHNHPFSRGTIHSVSNNPLDDPEIDPHYFENLFDLELTAQNVRYAKKIAETEPWKSVVVKGADAGLNYASDEELKEFVKTNTQSSFHAIGSASMLPREKNGVVDPELRVYGTANLRICDLSVIPLHAATHTQSVAYALGEKRECSFPRRWHFHFDMQEC
ncbi:GMC oxidoreductase [Obba rivulosa]|uniref:GMC oxidoreductase n=1 Tax=Obba rivulosa TaxID=1052685 RepID=A0A8E2DNJ8_9APHY|nr:GMC oxidoreductase [Obba rivulosa]